ncbi:MAG TPA: hypothetical protein VL576_01875 [Candidatus Paceibacterota bacterium]|jgi:hypothetical protein|nr:hypothetical protein [Candidatus Paceibacterota bacterium]
MENNTEDLTPEQKRIILLNEQQENPEKKEIVLSSGAEVEKRKDPEQKEVETKNPFEVTIVDTTQLAESQARDRGDARMTESKEDRSANIFTRTAKRIWKHNLFQEVYRQKEISKAREEIKKTGNILSDAAADAEANAAIVERFALEYDQEYKGQMLKEGETLSPENEQLNKEIKTLIDQHAHAPMTEAVFQEERNRILGQYTEKPGKMGQLYADNLFKVAQEVRKAIENGKKLEELNLDVKVRLGKAQEGLNTEAKKNTFEKLQNSKVGKYILNEGVVAAGVYSASKFLFEKTLRSKAAQLATFGGTAVAAGALAGVKEAARIERERAQYARESAKGLGSDPESKRRKEFADVNYETISMAGTISALEKNLEILKGGTVDPSVILNDFADIESRIVLGKERKIDLFHYSGENSVEVERTNLLKARAKLNNALRKELGEDKYKTMLEERTKNFSDELMKGEKGLEAKDKAFAKLKRSGVAKHVIKTALISAGAGIVAQEGTALVKSGLHSWLGIGKGEDSWIQGAFKSLTGKTNKLNQNATMLEAWRRSISGEVPRMPMGNETLGVIHNPLGSGDYNMRLPQGVSLTDHGNGVFDIVRNGETVASNVKAFDPSGHMNPDLKFELLKHDIYAGDPAMVGGHDPQSAMDYINGHKGDTQLVHRELHYDNDTPKVFDKNELEEKWGGTGIRNSFDHAGKFVGYEGSGLDEHGNYVLNINRMAADGSYHNHLSVNAQEAMKKGGLKMLFSVSRDTQQHVFQVEIDANGNAIIPKDSEIAKLMFQTQNGHAVFTGKYAEVAQVMGSGKDGVENVRILSTVVGHGHDYITDPGHPVVRLDVPGSTDYSVPPVIPAVPRTPLERAVETEKEKKQEPPKEAPKNATGEEKPKDSVVVDSIYQPENGFRAEEKIPAGTFAAHEQLEKAKKEMTKAEYDALREDLEFINKKIQSHEGIIAVDRNNLKSKLGRDLYENLKHIPDGDKPIQFNRDELRKIGDQLEKNLSAAVIVERKKKEESKTAPAPVNLPTGTVEEQVEEQPEKQPQQEEQKQEAPTSHEKTNKKLPRMVIETIDRALAKQLQGKPLDSGEAAVLKRNPEEAEKRLALLKANNGQLPIPSVEKQPARQRRNRIEKASFEDAEKRWTTDQDKALLRYLSYADTNKDPDFLNKQYNNEHDENGNLKPEWQGYADKIIEIEADPKKKEAYLEIADELHKYVTNAMKIWKVPLEKNTQSKSWAYFSIVRMQTIFDSKGRGRSGKDPIGNILNKKNKNAGNLLQSMADKEFGYVFSRAGSNEKEALLKKIAGTSQEQNILDLIKLAEKANGAEEKLKPIELIELGGLIREAQDEFSEKQAK